MEKKERNYGIDLLRIVTMYVIMILHVMGKGGILKNLEPLSAGYEAAWFLEIACYFSGTVYALISGYVLLNGKYRIANIVYLWLQVFSYGFVSTLLFFIFKREAVTLNSLKYVFFPVMSEAYWYFSAYFAAFFLIPVITYVIEHLKKVYLDIIVLFILIFLSFLPMFFSTDVFALRGGASFMWVVACIFLGTYMKKFDVLVNAKTWKLLLTFVLSVVVTWGSKLCIELIYGAERWNWDRGNVMVTYNSTPILLASIVLIPLFTRIPIKGKMIKVVKVVSPLTFGVYLGNCQALVWEYIITDMFADYAKLPVIAMLVCIVLAAMVVFLVGIAIDGLRSLVFELLCIRQRLSAVETAVLTYLEKRESL